MASEEHLIPLHVFSLVMRNTVENAGFAPALGRKLGRERRTAAFAALIASVALALSTVVVATVLSVGIANAGVADGVIGHEGSVFGIALLLGLAFIGMSGLSILPSGKAKRR
jgi:branched-subunit amino acid permease